MNINKLLQKKKLTGEEIGKAVIASLCYTYKSILTGKGQQTLFSDADLKKMMESIKTNADVTAYNSYIDFNRFIIKQNAVMIAKEECIEVTIQKLMGIIGTAGAVEDMYNQLSKQPVILTQKQYNDLAEKKRNDFFLDDNRKEGYYSLFNILDDAINYLVTETINNPNFDSPIREVLEKYQHEPVIDERILTKYNEVMGNGYYTLVDSGIRSDEVSEREWQELLINKEMRKVLYDTEDSYLVERILQKKQAIYNGATEEEAEAELTKHDIKNGLFKRVTWHYYEEPPKDLTKYDILSIGDLFEYYPVLQGMVELQSYDKEMLEQLQAYYKEFEELVSVVMADLDNKYFKAMLEDINNSNACYTEGLTFANGIFTEVPFERWIDILIKRRSLYNMGFYGYKFLNENTYILDTVSNFGMGVAILQEGDSFVDRINIDENGYYKKPEIYSTFSAVYGLERFTEDNPNYIEEYEAVERDRENVEEFLYYLKGMNKVFDIAISYTGIEELAIFKANVKKIEERLEAMQSLAVIIYSKIKCGTGQDEKKKQAKLTALKEVFKPVKTDYEPPQENVERAKNLITNQLQAFAKDNGELESLLMNLDRGLYNEE